jgi:hypothetical protein
MGEIASARITVQAYFQKLFYENQGGSRLCFVYNYEGKKCGRGILDFKDSESRARGECRGLWVTERRERIFEYFDRDHAAPPTYVLYFLIVEPVSNALVDNCWRRIGLGWVMQQERGVRTQRSEFILV